jgi:xylan 1,4-beta-xylosidase
LAAVALSAQQSVTIKVDVSKPMGRFEPIWAWVGHDEPNYTYTEEGHELLTRLSQLSSYPVHDRTHNLLTSGDGTSALKWGSTNAFTRDAFGKPVYNWSIVDRIFDTYQATGITPFVEIGFMPEALSPHPEPYRHHWPKDFDTGWAYPPNDYSAWSDLVYTWVRHMADRYGAEQVAKWEWEVWNEPHNLFFWHGSMGQMVRMTDDLRAIVKSVDPGAIIVSGIGFGALEAGAAAMQRDAGVPAVIATGGVELPVASGLVVAQLGDLHARPLAPVRRIPWRAAFEDGDGCAADRVLEPVVVGRALVAVRGDPLRPSR